MNVINCTGDKNIFMYSAVTMVYVGYTGIGNDSPVIKPEWLKPFAAGK